MTDKKQELAEPPAYDYAQMMAEFAEIRNFKTREERMSRYPEFHKKQLRLLQWQRMKATLSDLPFYFGQHLGDWSWITKSKS